MPDPEKPPAINLGDVARCTITGFTGVVVSRTEYLQGCRRLALQSQTLHEGRPVDWIAFDEPVLELVEARGRKPIGYNTADAGGPRPVPGERHRPEGRQ